MGARAGARARNGFPARGDDARYTLSVSFMEAALGAKRRITLPDGKSLDVAIPAGHQSGQVLRLRGQGQPGVAGGPPGDALIEVTVTPHRFFRREGDDIHLDLPVSLSEAVLGARVEVPTLTGKVALAIPPHSGPGTRLRLRGRGLNGGHQYVTLSVALPTEPEPARWRNSSAAGPPTTRRTRAGTWSRDRPRTDPAHQPRPRRPARPLRRHRPARAWLVAGAVVQTVWNHRFALPPTNGIADIDIVYFDPDLSEDTEAAHQSRLRATFPNLTARLDVKNQARVHQWYEAKFGKPLAPDRSVPEAIATYPTTATATGVRMQGGRMELCAPFGTDDLLAAIVRPNKVLVTQEANEAKAARWRRLWPGLTILPWE